MAKICPNLIKSINLKFQEVKQTISNKTSKTNKINKTSKAYHNKLAANY